MKFISGTNRN